MKAWCTPYNEQQTADSCELRQHGMKGDQETNKDNDGAQSVRNRVSAIGLVPGAMCGVQLSFPVHVLPILRRRVTVEKGHQWALADERNNTVGFIFGKLQSANPD